MNERAVIFPIGNDRLLGIIHEGAPRATRGVLIVVGGPQYRVGSHRQFLLLARHLAAAGVPVLRFDYRGMGDSEGEPRDFEGAGDDLLAAVDTFQTEVPGVREVVIWGLCDAVSIALMTAWREPRIRGLVLLNPWVRTEEGLARAYLKTYYLQRLLSRDFWGKLLRGRLNPVASLRSLLAMGRRALGRSAAKAGPPAADSALPEGPLPERMAAGWRRFDGPILLILSGDDLTAAEFRETAASEPAWQGLLDEPRVTRRELPEANHTFSRQAWRDQVAQWTLEWVRTSKEQPTRRVTRVNQVTCE
ncbi:hydrolase 1, exosortase A system-associated [Thiohalophilus sp.]|uniref:hydrolase 1, exosortase A system-associated n=1 Tax=Thiohalophilus sp. TaxID=3028392 RepID=UPI002ACDE173|nr:hydrolase 1, exosortase A system-associated [Thiohalophilus sp.]MDZ7803479.1 hydrolase 1, exosortase A system-associated [Thiohalophilus sp.]